MAARSEKPVPVADELSQPFWDAAKERRLAVQRCAECGYYNHPPRPFCDRCSSQRLEFAPVSGRGTMYTFTVMHQPIVAGFEGEAPVRQYRGRTRRAAAALDGIQSAASRNAPKSRSAAASRSGSKIAARPGAAVRTSQAGLKRRRMSVRDVAGQGKDRDRRNRLFGDCAPAAKGRSDCSRSTRAAQRLRMRACARIRSTDSRPIPNRRFSAPATATARTSSASTGS